MSEPKTSRKAPAEKQNGAGNGSANGSGAANGAFAVWHGQPVILRVTAGALRVPLRGPLVGETAQALRFRIGNGWDVDIYKNMVLAVEEDSWVDVT
jgi:hypothetical protein